MSKSVDPNLEAIEEMVLFRGSGSGSVRQFFKFPNTGLNLNL